MLKTLSKVVLGGKYLNIINTVYDKFTANTILIDEKVKSFLLNSGIRQGFSLSPLLFKVEADILAAATRRYSSYIQWSITLLSVSSVQSLSHVQLFATPWTAVH